MSQIKLVNASNAKELTDEVLAAFNDLCNGGIGRKEAKDKANLAGKAVALSKLLLEYNSHMKYEKKIPFLEY
jgi:hypothetical protein